MKTVRIRFSKTGSAKYISHLDLNRTMTRALRRAAIPLWYTEGFNRHPYLTFIAPLSLGFESTAELMDIRLVEEMPLDEVAARLNAVLPEGLHVLEAFEAVMKAGALRAAAYTLKTDCPAETVRALLAQSAVLVPKRTKKKEIKMIDIRPAFENSVIEEQDTGCRITVTLPCSGEETVNPVLLFSALEKAAGREISYRVMRTGLFAENGRSFL